MIKNITPTNKKEFEDLVSLIKTDPEYNYLSNKIGIIEEYYLTYEYYMQISASQEEREEWKTLIKKVLNNIRENLNTQNPNRKE